jgi:hypothetical protein
MDVNIFTLFATCFGMCSAIFTETIQIQQWKSIILMYRANLFCTMTNKCKIISQITTLLHVSTLSCHPQGACNQ